LSARPTPAIVPPVPAAATNASSPPRLREDLGSRRPFVRVTVGSVLELIGPHGAGDRFGKPTRFVVVVALIAEGNRLDDVQLGAVRAQQLVFLRRLIVRHDDDRAIAARVADQRQPDAGVPGRPFDDDARRAEKPARFEVLDDPARRAVLHRTARVEVLRFAQNGAAERAGKFGERDQRRVSDRADEAVTHDAGLSHRG
jgi:hypothetical protein